MKNELIHYKDINMRIGLLTQYYKPEMGAPQNRLFEMMRGLRDLGNEVCVITAMPNYPTGKIFDSYKGKLACKENMDGIEIKRYWLYASNSRNAIPRIWNMVSFSFMALFSLRYLKTKHLDYLIVESPPLTLGIVGILISKIIGCKLIANISDIWPLSARELGAINDGALYHYLEKWEKRIYRFADFSMGQSQEIVDHIANHGGKKTYLFRNGVDPRRFEFLKGIRPESDKIKLVYAGLLGFAQGISDICRSINFAELGVEFHIYGAGGEQKEIEEFIANNPNNGIYYHGVVSRDELPIKLKEANMTLIPLVKNIYGAVPSKIYESMAAGLPIMFVGEGEGARIVKDNKIGLVAHAKDYDGLKRNIEFAVTHHEEMELMTKNCIECANNKFNRPKQISALNQYLIDNL